VKKQIEEISSMKNIFYLKKRPNFFSLFMQKCLHKIHLLDAIQTLPKTLQKRNKSKYCFDHLQE